MLALQEVGPEQVLADLNAACSIDFDNRLDDVSHGVDLFCHVRRYGARRWAVERGAGEGGDCR